MVIALGHMRVSEDIGPFNHFSGSSECGFFLWGTSIPFFRKKDREAQDETIIFVLASGWQNIAYPPRQAHPMTLKKVYLSSALLAGSLVAQVLYNCFQAPDTIGFPDTG